MFEADLLDVDSLSRTNIFRFSHCVNIGVQHDGFAGINGHLCASKAQEKFFFKRPAPYAFVMVGVEKLIGKALLLVGFRSYFDSRTY